MTPAQVTAITFTAPNQVAIGRFALPAMQDDQLLLRTHYTFVSPGTECRVLDGHYGAAGRFPLIPGCCAVGEVIAVGAKCPGWKVGDLATYTPDCDQAVTPIGIHSHWGGHVSHHLVPLAMKPVRLPVGCNLLDYSFCEVAAISLRGCLLARPQPGETVVVIGLGAIGAFSAAWHASMGARVIVADLAQPRLERALRNGAAFAVDSREPDAEARIHALCPRGGADIVVESAGLPATLALAARLLRRAPRGFRDPRSEAVDSWPRLVCQANYLDKLSMEPHSFFAGEGVQLITPMDRNAEDRAEVVERIRRRAIEPQGFIDQVVPVTEAPTMFAALRDTPHSVFSVVFDWTRMGQEHP